MAPGRVPEHRRPRLLTVTRSRQALSTGLYNRSYNPAPTPEHCVDRMNDGASEAILKMHHLCRQPDGGPKIVRWLHRRTGSWFGLIDRAGAILVGEPAGLRPTDVPVIKEGLALMTDRELRAFSVDAGPARSVLLLELAAPGRATPVLTVVDANPASRSLAADAAAVIGTWWWAEETRRAQRRLSRLEARNREAVLHLLMSGHLPTAHQVSSALSSPLPDPLRVHVVECSSRLQDSVAQSCNELAPPGTFVVPCPVYRRHVIALAPSIPGSLPFEDAIVRTPAGCSIGTSEVVPLSDTAMGYEQALDALAIARAAPSRRATFRPELDPAVLLAPMAGAWATGLLAPLSGYRPARESDPGVAELMATAQSWLSFANGATRQLKIHRNTLRGRMHRIETLLELDLDDIADQAALALALRVRRWCSPAQVPTSTGSGTAPTFADLVSTPEMGRWAQAVLRPVRAAPNAAPLETSLRAWLAGNARLSETAAALGLSVPGTRKRIQRLEQLLGRSLLHAPDARHDLYLAVRSFDTTPLGRTPV